VEYKDPVSRVYENFPSLATQPGTSVLIWDHDTLDFCLPNLAVALTPVQYSLRAARRTKKFHVSTLLVLRGLEMNGEGYEIVCRAGPVMQLARATYQHPFLQSDREILRGSSLGELHRHRTLFHVRRGRQWAGMTIASAANGCRFYSPVMTMDGWPTRQICEIERRCLPKWWGIDLENKAKSDANEAVCHELRVKKALINRKKLSS